MLREREALFPDVPGRLLEVVDTWDLRVTDPMQQGWDSFVVVAATSEDVVVVLKLTAEREAIAREAAALGWWGEEVAPRVLRHDDRLGAMLMERLEPGDAIDWRSAADTAEVVSVLEGAHRPLAGARLPLPLLSDLGAEELETMRQDAEQKRRLVNAEVADMALVLLGHLFAPTETTDHVVLHGDAVPDNVLLTHDGLRVIDPRPAIGERAHDAGYWSTFSGYGRDSRSNVSILARTFTSMSSAYSHGHGRLPLSDSSSSPIPAILATALYAISCAALSRRAKLRSPRSLSECDARHEDRGRNSGVLTIAMARRSPARRSRGGPAAG